MKLHELGEDRLLEKILGSLPPKRGVIAGPGDDCAVAQFRNAAERLVLKTDCVVEDVHFTRDAAPRAVGWKAMARPLSDFAAMAAVPQLALVTLIVSPDTTVHWTRELYAGLRKAADAFDIAIVGGETSRTAGAIVVSVALTGFVEPDGWVSRRGGHSGDALFVTGRLGGSRGGRHLRFIPRITEARWLTKNFEVHAMMDLSDGLGADLPRLAGASNLGFQVEQSLLPRNRGCSVEQAISDGEDYELLFAVPPAVAEHLPRKWRKRFPRVALTRIGQLTSHPSDPAQQLPRGYVHFQ